jgi:hypothetical protein
MLMSAVLVMMVPITGLDKGAPFAAAFAAVNMDWARYIVALGALMGIVTTTLVSSSSSSDGLGLVICACLFSWCGTWGTDGHCDNNTGEQQQQL